MFATGDGGMHREDLDLYRHLEAWGYPLVGFDARDYVKHLGASDTTTPERLAQDYRQMIAAARDALRLGAARHVVLVGVSRGAGLSVVAAGELHDAIAGVVAIALTREEEYVRWYRRLLVFGGARAQLYAAIQRALQWIAPAPPSTTPGASPQRTP